MLPLEDYDREYVFAEYPQNVSSMSGMAKYSNIEPSDPEAEELFTSFSCVRTSDTKYIRRTEGREELYEYTSDSGRVETDISSVGEKTYDDLRRAIDDTLSHLPSIDDIAPDHPDDIVAYAQEVREVDPVEEQRLKDLGYL
jgi:hypothetical protein